MTGPEQIPHLVKLLDDESCDVLDVVVNELSAFGPNLKDELRKISTPLTVIQRRHLDKIVQDYKGTWLRHTWPGLLNQLSVKEDRSGEYQKLEKILSMFSEFLSGYDSTVRLGDLLDDLANGYQVKYKDRGPIPLAKFLFKDQKLRGDENNYYNPQNGNLNYVIKEKRGIPVSLTAVYMLVGMRLGIEIEGCHFPGHFLARIDIHGKNFFVDCFNGGQAIEEKDLLSIRDGALQGMGEILHETVGTETMVRCYLASLIRSFQVQEEEASCQLLIELFKDLDGQSDRRDRDGLTPEAIINYAKPIFKPGQRVRHLRYGYRGIVVDVNQNCQATDGWYYGNQTQPNRNQPWYHVLVHGAEQVTYVAQANLMEDLSGGKVRHPLLSYFFKKTKEGRYIRNNNPWPETDF